MRFLLVFVALLISILSVEAQTSAPVDANTLVRKIEGELRAPFSPPEGNADPALPHGEILKGTISDTAFYPGTENDFQVYVPAQYDPAKPACLLVKLDGLGDYEANVLDHLIAKKEVPVMIGVGISPGQVFRDPPGTPNRRLVRFNRDFQYDSTNDRFVNFVLKDLLPRVETMKTANGRAIQLSQNPDDRMAMGTSSGGIGTFTFAWQRPDQFHRVFDSIGTFVSMRGGHEYPALVRKTEPKPIRIFLEDGSNDAWNPLFGSWFEANQEMESALTFAGYDVAHAWGTHGHDGRPGLAILPDVMRWLWRDYPAPIVAGVSKNATLQEILAPGEGWEKIPPAFTSATSLAADGKGNAWVSDSATGVFEIGDTAGGPKLANTGVEALAFGPDGTLYASDPAKKNIINSKPDGSNGTVDGIDAEHLLVTHDGTIYATEPGAHCDMPSTIWRIKPGGAPEKVDEGLHAASGLAISPDGALFFAAENSTKWIYSYVVDANGSFSARQPFYWLHMTDVPNDSGAEDMAFDRHGNLYVATRLGIQVCDQNGRVRAILPLPTPCGPVRSLCFGGPNFDTLYVTDGQQIFKRTLKVPGYMQWSPPVAYPSGGEG
jgi:gluconolactonase